MREVVDLIGTISETPLPTILVLAGLFFLLLSVAGRLGAMIVVSPRRQALAALIGAVLLVAGTALTFLPQDTKKTDAAEGTERQEDRPVLTPEILTTTEWTFLHREGDIISPNVRLDASGRIEGIDHPNETRWGLEDNVLVFYDQYGRPSTRFTEVTREEGRLTLSGRLLLTDEVVIHVLREHCCPRIHL